MTTLTPPPGDGQPEPEPGQPDRPEQPGRPALPEPGPAGRTDQLDQPDPIDPVDPVDPVDLVDPPDPVDPISHPEQDNRTEQVPQVSPVARTEQLPPTSAPAQHRRLADRYRLDGVLGRGATGTVWSAYDEVLQRRVAVKEVPPPPGMPVREADTLRERTLREARAIAMLSHPNVVTLYDVVRQDGEPFVVMELLPASSLAELIRQRGALDTGGAAIVGIAVASALQAAHRAGITHRDIKPANVLVGEDGRIKLTDFGISRNLAETTLTATGMTLGSPAFIAPEVASGSQVTPAADLWGLGATLFAAVEGRPPYDSDGDPVATVAAVVHGEVPTPVSAGGLAPVISGLMVKDPAGRLPLERVRQLLRPLLPADGAVLRADSPTTEFVQVPRATGPVVPPLPVPPSLARPVPAAVDGPQWHASVEQAPLPLTTHGYQPLAVQYGHPGPGPGGQLATDPGPLPFHPQPPQRRKRSVLARTVVALACVVLFSGGSAGGFALARTAAGASLLPEREQPVVPSSPASAAPSIEFDERSLTIDQTDPGGQFRIGVPPGWQHYRADLNLERPGLAMLFVSPDGQRTIAVERLGAFYANGNMIDDYRGQLDAELAKSFDAQTVLNYTVNGTPLAGAAEPPHELTYRTVSAPDGAAAEMRRTTFVQLVPTRKDLWVLKVTVPNELEEAGRVELFDPVRETFGPG